MDVSTLVQAVIIYMKDHYPTTPEEFNFQAELKAACHWHWKDDERPLESGPHDDCRVKIAAKKTFRKWVKELDKIRAHASAKRKRSPPVNAQGKDRDNGSSHVIDDNRISGETIFLSLSIMYLDKFRTNIRIKPA